MRSSSRTQALLGSLAAALVLAACSGTAAAGLRPRTQGTEHLTSSGAHGTSSTHPKPAPKPKSRPAPAPRPARLDDGSLGDRATREACALLSRAQIAGQFGGPVGVPTPTYPYCQWLVGSDAFLALAVEPGVGYGSATQWVVPLETLHGIGSAAMIANNRFLYFSAHGSSYWLLWQQVGDFSELHTAQLSALARDVAARALPRGQVGLPRAPPAGPTIYFAGDSTAAGPQWAYVTQYSGPGTRTLAEYQVGTGLVVPQFFDWGRHILAVTAARRPALVVWMGSANDGQALVVGGKIAAVGSAAWRKAYGTEVGSVMASLLREGAKVLWIGEPAMQDPTLDAEMRAVDQVYAAEAKAHHGVWWFDPGTVLDGPDGSYRGSLVIDGQSTPVRLDGIHLNVEGSLYLARFIAKIIDVMLRPTAGGRPAPARTGWRGGRLAGQFPHP